MIGVWIDFTKKIRIKYTFNITYAHLILAHVILVKREGAHTENLGNWQY